MNKRRYRSTSPPRMHFFCSSPIMIDKSASWGEGNVQSHPNGAWVQIRDGKVSHLVDDDNGSPRGWQPHFNPNPLLDSLFTKRDVYAIFVPEVSQLGVVKTKDGEMHYNPTKYPNGAYLVFNIKDEKLDETDPWLVDTDTFESSYEPR